MAKNWCELCEYFRPLTRIKVQGDGKIIRWHVCQDCIAYLSKRGNIIE